MNARFINFVGSDLKSKPVSLKIYENTFIVRVLKVAFTVVQIIILVEQTGKCHPNYSTVI